MTSPDRRPSPGRMLRRALGARRADLVAASVLYSLHQFGEAMVPVIIGAAVGTGIAQRSVGSILLWLIVLGADFVLLSLCYRFGARASMRAKQHTAHRVRSWLMARILDQAGGVTQAPGELLIRTSSDAGRIGALAGVLASAIAASVVLVVTVGLLLWYSVLLGVVIVVGTALLLLAVGAVARRLARSSGAEQHAAGRAAVLAEDLVRGLRVLKGIGAERTAQQDYARASGAALVAALRAVSSRSEVAAVSALLTGVYVAIVAAIGGWLALSGSLGLGQLVSALGLAQFLIGPLQVLASTGAASARARASALRVQEILEAPTAVRGPEAAITDSVGARRPDVVDVSARDPYVEIRGVPLAGSPITFTARAGELTGVVAEAGAAAHLARLLARDQDPPAGAIVLGGVELSRMPLDELRARMLVSPHEAALFPGSIDDNVALAAADPAARDRGSRAALADQVIRTLPEGGAWQVGERGQYLSGGQRQRVALARAIAAEPEVLVLHDPTTAVDAATEDLIAERLALARAGMTTIVITSAPAVLSRCAQVVVLGADGVVSGRHTDLLQRHAVYRRLVIR